MLGNACEPLALLSTEPGAQRLPSWYAPIWARASAQLARAARSPGDSRALLRRPSRFATEFARRSAIRFARQRRGMSRREAGGIPEKVRSMASSLGTASACLVTFRTEGTPGPSLGGARFLKSFLLWV